MLSCLQLVLLYKTSAGDYFVLSGVTGTGFNIKIKNGTSFIDKQFTFQAVGYGKGCNMEESIFKWHK